MYISNTFIRLVTIAILLQSSCQGSIPPSAPASPCPEVTPTRVVEATVSSELEVIETVTMTMMGGNGVVAVNRCTGYAYIAGSHHVAIFKGKDKIGELRTGGDATFSIAIDELGGWIYVVNTDSDNVTVIHEKDIVGVVPTVGRNPSNVAVEPHSQFAYIVSNYKNRPLGDIEGNILVLKGTQVIDNLNFGRLALAHIVADPSTGLVYAGDITGKIIVLKGLQEVARYDLKAPLDPYVTRMDVNPNTGEVFALADQKLYRFKEGRLLDSVELVPNMGNVWQMRVHPVTGAVYISHTGYVRGEARIVVVQGMKVIEDIKVGGLSSLGIDPLTGNVYVAIFGDGVDQNMVTVINGTKVLAKIKTGWHPFNIGINPTNGWVYVSNINDGTVTVLGYPQSKQTAPMQMGTPVIPNRVTPVPYP